MADSRLLDDITAQDWAESLSKVDKDHWPIEVSPPHLAVKLLLADRGARIEQHDADAKRIAELERERDTTLRDIQLYIDDAARFSGQASEIDLQLRQAREALGQIRDSTQAAYLEPGSTAHIAHTIADAALHGTGVLQEGK